MKSSPFKTLALLFVAIGCGSQAMAADATRSPYGEWKHSGSMFVLTTPDGADWNASNPVKDFPLLVRFHRSWFDFATALPDGADLRFASVDGTPLAYEIEQWSPARGEAAVWVRVPEIRANARQELRVFWGKPEAKSESSGKAVFNASNGYLSVWHLNGAPNDTVGTLPSEDRGTTPTEGMIGEARHFAGKQGVFCGDKITGYPTGSGEHSTQLWYRAEVPNTTLIGWGNEAGGRGSKVRMLFRGPPHIRIDSNFSDVWTTDRLRLNEWTQVTHTYAKDDGRIYIDGRLAGEAKPTLNIKSPARLWLGGWFHNYDFIGDLDEVRISSVARSADWIQLEYENQKQFQSLVGPIVQSGNELSLSASEIEVDEGANVTLTAKAGGAQKFTWMETGTVKGKPDHVWKLVYGVDQLTHTFEPGRVYEDSTTTLTFAAAYPDGIRTRTATIKIKDKYPDPEFTLQAPATWDGRTPLEIVPTIKNLAALQTPGSGELRYKWIVDGPAVVKDELPDKLILQRGLGTGPLHVRLTLQNNFGFDDREVTIQVAEPPSDSWLERKPEADERPVDGQFYARNPAGFGTLTYNGTLVAPEDKSAAQVFLRVYAGDERIANETHKLGPDKAYAFAVPLKAGLVKYRAEFGSIDAGGAEKILHTAAELMCGDAFLIIGQSNAVATDFGRDAAPPPINEWIRTFGATEGGPTGSRLKRWAPAQARNAGGVSEIGYWGMELGRRLIESQAVPICLINGAVGGTRIDQHQRNMADPTDVTTIYGRLLWRVREAKLTHGIRGIIWHQGENDQGADGPTGDFGWVTYRKFFHELVASWQRDYPNVRHRYLFQIWPKSCAMGVRGSDNMLREVQRTLPRGVSKLSVLSTLGINPPGGCHFPAAGYAEFARMLAPLIERDDYGKKFADPITPPNLLRASFASTANDMVALEFDQPVVWNDKLAGQFYAADDNTFVAGGSVRGNTLTLRLKKPMELSRISYLDSKAWSGDNLLLGTNGLAALTFCQVEVEPAGR